MLRYWIAIATILPVWLGLQGSATAEGIGDGPAKTQVVPLYVSSNRPLMMLTIGNAPLAPVAFDTGTDENILQRTFADRLKLKIVGSAPLTDNASGQSRNVPVVALEEPRLSGAMVSPKTAEVLDYKIPNEVGVFGPNSFAGNYVIIEGPLNRLRIVPKNSGYLPPGPGEPYRDHLPSYPITINGLRVDAHLDSGNDGILVLGGALASKIKLTAPPTIIAIAQSALGSQNVLGGQLDGSVRIGPLELRGSEVTFADDGNSANVGFPVIRQLTIVLDPANQRSWVLDPSDLHSPLSDLAGTFGPRVIRTEGGRLTYQREGRPAHDLRYLGGDLFEMSDTRDRIQFYRKNGRVVRLELITEAGEVVTEHRTN